MSATTPKPNAPRPTPGLRTGSPLEAAFWAVVDQAAAFCRRNRHRIKGLDDRAFPHLREELAFHAAHKTLAIVWAGDEIAGVSIVWQTNATDIYAAEQGDRQVFDWKPTNPHGDCVYLGLVISERPGAMRPLAAYYLKTFPHWRVLPGFAHRRGKLVMEAGLLERLAGDLKPQQKAIYG